MIKVGITGGIGTGKTTITRIFSVLGVPVYDADSRAKVLMVTDPDLIASIKAEFGSESYLDDGQLNRKHLATAFADPGKLDKLNKLVHPQVGKDFILWSSRHSKSPYIIKEAALLFESGSYKLLDKIITVTSPLELRLQRLFTRDPHRSVQQIQDIISRQLPEAIKIEKADFVIENDETRLLVPQVLFIDQAIKMLDEN